MKTTLNIPDGLAREAKRVALLEGTTLTRLIVEGLENRLEKTQARGPLPVSGAAGGLREGVSWDHLVAAEPDEESYR